MSSFLPKSENAQLENDIKNYFNGYFDKQMTFYGCPVIKDKQLTLDEVSQIALDKNTPLSIVENFSGKLVQARNLMNGEHNMCFDKNGKPYKYPKFRILFILYKTGLTIWID